jgi:hypothetical protein
MIDLYPVLAIPLCAFLAMVFKKKSLAIPVMVLWLALVSFSCFKTYQSRKQIISIDAMTRDAYWLTFFSTEIPPDYHYCLRGPDYELAKRSPGGRHAIFPGL